MVAPLAAVVAGGKPLQVDLCNLPLLANQLEGKVIRVRGVLRNSGTPEEPSFDELVPESCLDSEGRRAVIHVVSPDSHFLDNPPQGYKPDLSSVRRVEPIFRKAAANNKSVSVIVEGVLQTAQWETTAHPRHKQYSASIVIQAFRSAKER
jgi:hypothetical protein